MATKRQLLADEAHKARTIEQDRVKEILVANGTWSTALYPLLETYLDAFEIYFVMYNDWRSIGFKATKRHRNKAGATNEVKHPLAQQVETWSLKKAKYLNQLGLDSKNKKLKNTGQLIAEKTNGGKKEKNNKLVDFKKRHMAGGNTS
ncbi:P27 family phage terminase small subunit [Listeria monocytogenes]|nr:P27 family phage terminase small subunit [Listeria monocytogenes]EBF5108499.1 P27 family phage terminase small subunit [Listeria monocytogenes]EFR8994863.1 P27 family phage terminase small subunit [Listeria monocytogenes]EKZ0885087.1 P27 family phage terminase small subunit [Listeria monocytogenes]